MQNKKHIHDAQPPTVDEHFQLILENRDVIDSEFVKVTPDDLPEWFDERLFKIGQACYMDNLLGFGTANLAGLVAILAVPEILDVLVSTKRNSSLCLSYKRFTQTLLLMYALFKSDMLDSNSKWFKALNVIRWKHAMTSKRRIQRDLHGIYQKDMAITQFGFVGFVFICPEKVGLAHITEEEMIGVNHFWQVTGYLLGITDRINICRKTIAETKELCRRIGYEIIGNYMRNPPSEFEELTSNAVNGLWYVDASLNEGAFMYLTYDMIGQKYKKPLGWYSYINLKRQECTLYLCSVPYIGRVVRLWINSSLQLLYWVTEKYPIRAWLAFGKKNATICLYPKI